MLAAGLNEVPLPGRGTVQGTGRFWAGERKSVQGKEDHMAMTKKTPSKAATKPVAKAASAKKPAVAKQAKPAAQAKPQAVKKPAVKRTPNAAFMKPLQPSATLAAVVGSAALPRTEVVKKIWEYIKKHKLQDAANKRMINADDKLKPLFGGKAQASMFELTKFVSAHLS
ncbi:MAG: hypothetical protein IOMNBAOH_01656 [Rhodocyclaceae bacterium]|nr:hypothetical protein [Rhodocyclaceae bacterium]